MNNKQVSAGYTDNTGTNSSIFLTSKTEGCHKWNRHKTEADFIIDITLKRSFSRQITAVV